MIGDVICCQWLTVGLLSPAIHCRFETMWHQEIPQTTRYVQDWYQLPVEQ